VVSGVVAVVAGVTVLVLLRPLAKPQDEAVRPATDLAPVA
jgi:hypothetical protein